MFYRYLSVLTVLLTILLVSPVFGSIDTAQCEVTVSPGANLSDVADANAPGTTFCLNDGTYTVSRSIDVDSSDVWAGLYSDTTRPTIVTTQADNVMNANGSNGASVQDITVRGAVGDEQCRPACGKGIQGGSNLTLTNIRATDNDNQGVGGQGDGLLVQDSVLDFNGSPAFYLDGTYASAAGLKSVNSFEVRNSRVTDNVWNGVWCDLECNNMVVTDSILSDNGKSGVFYEVSAGGAVVANNVIQNNGAIAQEITRMPAGLLVTSSQNIDAYGNTFGGNIPYGFRAIEDSRSPKLSNVRFHNNDLNGDKTSGCNLPGVACKNN